MHTKHSKTNQLQKTIEYKTNESCTKYSISSMEIQRCRIPGSINRQVKYLQFLLLKLVYIKLVIACIKQAQCSY